MQSRKKRRKSSVTGKKKNASTQSFPKATKHEETTARKDFEARPGILSRLLMKKAFWGVLIGVALVGLAAVLFRSSLSDAGKERKLQRLNVILITLDTLRADYVSAYHGAKAETPNLDNVAAEGVLFESCIAQTPLTLPSHTSILSGTYPTYHQIRDNGGFLVPDNLLFISEILRENGFTTSAFIASYVLHSKWGINQGFDTYSDDFDLSKYRNISLGNVQKRADVVLSDARKWMGSHKNEKFFAWIHLYDPHTPYDPPSPYKEKYPKRPYRGEVEFMDHQLGLFFDFLKQEGIYDNSLLILAADHGESLGQHGESTHGFFIYEPTVHVPLIIRAPFGFRLKKVKAVVELIDIVPTILDSLNIPIPRTIQGQSLLGAMFGREDNPKDVAYTETYYPRFHYGWSELKAYYFDKTWKYILAPRDELYDLEKDRGEKNNLALMKSYQAKKVKARLLDFIKKRSENALKPGDETKMDKDDLQKLAALGYLTTFVNTRGRTDLPDPKGKVHVFNDLAEAKELLGKGRVDESIVILQKIIVENPQIVDVILQLGNAYAKKGMFQEALDSFYRVLEQKPDYHAAMINIANSLVRLEQFDKGIEEVNRFLKVFPNDHSLYNELGVFYLHKKDYSKALEALNKSLELEKVNPHAFNKIGEVYVIQGDMQKAASHLEKALAINPNLRRLHFNLAQIAEGSGNIQQAIRHYKKELENYPESYKSAYNLAELLRKKGSAHEAVEYYRKTIEINPNFNIPYFMVAKYSLDRKKNLDEAIDLCDKGLKIKPYNKYTAFGYYILADIYSFTGKQRLSSLYFSKGEKLKGELKARQAWD